MNRCEFYALVVDIANKKGITQVEAYDEVEKLHEQKHNQRKYVNYQSFYHVNYRAVVRELTQGKENSEKIKELNRLCEEFRQGKMTQVQMVDNLKKHIL